MLFTRSQLVVACALASTLFISACSKENSAQKQDSLTASTPATGEASTLNERNTQQRLVTTLEKHFKTANINAKILAIKKTEVPNLFWVSLEGMGSVYATSDGQYIIQGDVIHLGEKQLRNVSESLQAGENKKHLATLKTEDLIVYPAQGGKAKHVIYVFTDSSCPYCHKLHEHLAEINAIEHKPMYMDDYVKQLDSVLSSGNRKLLTGSGSVSHKQALEKAKSEYRKYQEITLTPVEKAYLESIKEVSKEVKRR